MPRRCHGVAQGPQVSPCARCDGTALGETHSVRLGLPGSLWHTAILLLSQTPPGGQPPPWPAISVETRTTMAAGIVAEASTWLSVTSMEVSLSAVRNGCATAVFAKVSANDTAISRQAATML